MSDELATALVTLRVGDLSGWINGRIGGEVSVDGGWIVVDDGDRVEIPPGHGALVVEDEDGAVEVSLLPLDLDAFGWIAGETPWGETP